MSTNPAVIRILSADDHPQLREGVAALIASQTDMLLVAEAANGHEAVEQFRSCRPDVTLMDLQMPEMSGIDALIAIRGEFPRARINPASGKNPTPIPANLYCMKPRIRFNCRSITSNYRERPSGREYQFVSYQTAGRL